MEDEKFIKSLNLRNINTKIITLTKINENSTIN